MRSLNRISTSPVSLPLLADDILEFHAARLLLLVDICGTSGRIDGLTKMAKLDFFARYPAFFETARAANAKLGTGVVAAKTDSEEGVEAAMVRHHYGPWDKRYYQVLASLEAKALIAVTKEKGSYQIELTGLGQDRAKVLSSRPSYAGLVLRMREIKKAFGGKSGNAIKNLIYQVFDAEVNRRPLGELIQ